MATMSTAEMPVLPGAYKLRDAAKYCGGIHPETLRRAMKRGLLKGSRATRHLLFTRAELDRFLNDTAN